MIEVLKEGTKRQIECRDCGALLRYQKEDVQCRENWLDARTSYTQKYIVCPQCHEDIILEAQR